MAKGKEYYSRYQIEEVLTTLSKNEKTKWGKFVIRSSYNDAPSTLSIRQLGENEDGTYIIGKGINLDDNEADRLTESLVDTGYGDLDTLEASCKKRRSIYYPEEK
jgi:hypothetical protein